jgi:hypothetical protein
MADWAMLTCVASLPSAFCTVRSEAGRPAAVNAALRYGASNSSHRVDEVVSGRMTATLPLPDDASEVSLLRAVNEGSMSPTAIDGALAEAVGLADVLVEPVAALVLELLLELQAAIRSAAATLAVASPALFAALFVI